LPLFTLTLVHIFSSSKKFVGFILELKKELIENIYIIYSYNPHVIYCDAIYKVIHEVLVMVKLEP